MASTRSEAKYQVLEKMVLGLEERDRMNQHSLQIIEDRLEAVILVNKENAPEFKELVEQFLRVKGCEKEESRKQVSEEVDKDLYLKTTDGDQRSDMHGERNFVFDEMKHALRRIDLPIFDGADPMGWISKAEQYFEIQGTPMANKIQIAMICMEGAALHWCRWIKKRIPNITWDGFAQELIRRYGGRKACNPYELLASLKQGQNSVEEYVEQFEQLMALIEGLSEAQTLGYFFSGLEDEIRRKVRTHGPITINRAIELARLIEDEILGLEINSRENKKLLGYVGAENDSPNKTHYKNWVRPNQNPFIGVTKQGKIGVEDEAMKEIQSERGGQNSSAMACIQSSGGGGCNTSVSGANIARGIGNIPRENRSYSYQEFIKRKKKGISNA